MAFVILIALTALAWVVLILPRQRELKRHQGLMGTLEVGDDVMMTSGIYGVIRDIEGDYVQLEIAPDLQIRIAKRSIAARVEPADAPDDVSSAATERSDTDSVAGEAIGQTPVREADAERFEGTDGDDAVIDLDDETDSRQGNEA